MIFTSKLCILSTLSVVNIFFQGVFALHAVCQPHTDDPCPESWNETSNPRLCLKLIPEILTYNETYERCRSLGGISITLESINIADVMKDFQRNVFEAHFWLALNDRLVEGQFRWGIYATGSYQALQYTHWKPGHPRTGIEGDNIDAVRVNSRYLTWTNVNGDLHASVVCEVAPQGGQCKAGYVKYDKTIKMCLKDFRREMRWGPAKRACFNDKASLPVIDSRQKEVFYEDFFRRRSRILLNIDDEVTESTWVWRNGAPSWYTNWGPNEPSNTRTENCAVVDYNGIWYDVTCGAKLPTVCQIESEDSPEAVEMKAPYHVPPNKIYLGQMLTITCSAIQTDDASMTWLIKTVNRGVQDPKGIGANVHSETEGIKTVSGTCENKTTSTLSFIVDRQKHDGIFISCYAYQARGVEQCMNSGNRFSFCDTSRKLQVISGGPNEPPQFNVTYIGYPGRVDVGTTVSATCSLLHDGTGFLVWVIYYPSGPVLYTRQNDTATFDDKTMGNAHLLTTTISFIMKESLSFAAVACFAYDVAVVRNTSLACHDGEVYCVKSHTIVVKEPRSTGLLLLYALGALFVSLLIISPCLLCILCFTPLGDTDAYSGEQDEVHFGITLVRKYRSTRRRFRTFLGLENRRFSEDSESS